MGGADKKWPIIWTVVALISACDVITTKSSLSSLHPPLSVCLPAGLGGEAGEAVAAALYILTLG